MWLTLTDLQTGARYRVFKNFLIEDCCGEINQIVVTNGGSVAFQTSYGENNARLYACELSTCYDRRGYGRKLRRDGGSRGDRGAVVVGRPASARAL